MSLVWNDGSTPEEVRITPFGWLRIGLRGVPLVLTLLLGLGATLILRPLEKRLFGLGRPVTPWITQTVCRFSLFILGIRLKVTGHQMKRKGAVVANHSSWLDVFVLNARKRIYFVAKDEISGWPGISWLAKATGTVFIRRDRKAASAQVELFRARLGAGHKLLFFPEGTSTDSRRVLPFKTTLFAAFFDEELHEQMHIQPVTVLYHAPKGRDARFFGWWGNQGLTPHLMKVLAQWPQGQVELIYHAPARVADFANRKALASHLEDAVRAPIALELAKAAE
jgi:lyso-ornithine lipid O-acyltransferase